MSDQDASKPKTLIVVEDEPSIVQLLGYILESQIIKVHYCLTGEEGLATIVGSKPDLIMLDVMLPGINGWQIYDYVRNDTDLKATPIIMLSVTQPGSGKRRAAFQKNANDFFINKPFDMHELRHKIEEMLDLKIW